MEKSKADAKTFINTVDSQVSAISKQMYDNENELDKTENKIKKNDSTYETDTTIKIEIKDEGVGIENIEKAREPLFTTKPELERSGMGFMFMEMFMDELIVESEKGRGTKVSMTKRLTKQEKI